MFDIHLVDNRFPVNFRGFPWESMDVHGNPWISMEVHGSPWKSNGKKFLFREIAIDFYILVCQYDDRLIVKSMHCMCACAPWALGPWAPGPQSIKDINLKDIKKYNKEKKIIIVCSGAIALGSALIKKNQILRLYFEKF